MFQLLLSTPHTESRPFLPHPTPPEWELGVHKELWGNTVRNVSNWQRIIPYQMASWSAYTARGRRKRVGTFGVMAFLSSRLNIKGNRILFFWRWLNICASMGSGEWIPDFALLMWVSFALPVKLSMSQPTNFLTFAFQILFSIPPGESEKAAVVFGCCWGLNHSTHHVQSVQNAYLRLWWL